IRLPPRNRRAVRYGESWTCPRPSPGCACCVSGSPRGDLARAAWARPPPFHAGTICAVATLSILMPVFNERPTVLAAIEDAVGAALPVDGREVVLVDDGSDDGTSELLADADLPAGVQLHRHPRNLGKGAAIRTALEHATGEFSAILDADL